MTELSQNFDRAYALVKQNMENSGSHTQFPGCRVAWYLGNCTPGVLDVQDLMGTDRAEFLQMAYYGLFGTLPEQAVIQEWQSGTELSDWAYRKAVLDRLMSSPEVAVKDIVIRNNIYADVDAGQRHGRRGLKQRILSAGYRVSRKLPLGIKAPLKKLVMRLLMRS